MTQVGEHHAFGVVRPRPLIGFPKGRCKIRMRVGDWVRVYVRPKAGGIREFVVKQWLGCWWPSHEQGRNVRTTNAVVPK